MQYKFEVHDPVKVKGEPRYGVVVGYNTAEPAPIIVEFIDTFGCTYKEAYHEHELERL